MDPVAGSSGLGSSKQRRRRLMEPGGSILDSPRKKMKGGVMSIREKNIVINVFKYVKESWPSDAFCSNPEMVKKTADISGVSVSSIYNIINEYKVSHTVTASEKKRKRKGVLDELDDFNLSAIRKIVHSFFKKGELPTLKKVQHAVSDDASLPDLSLSALRQVLIKRLKFKYMKRRRMSALIDRDEIMLWRINYLSDIQRYRRDNRRIFFLDETWVNAGHTVSETWVDTEVKSSKQAFLEGLSTGAKAPTSKGKRLIVVNIGNEDGFIPECDLIFESNSTADYHESMNADRFEKWFSTVLQKLKPNDIIVMDNASYHSRRVEKTPTMEWRKADIQEWLRSKNIAFPDNDTKIQLMEKVKPIRCNYQKYVTDEMAREKGITVLRLPPYHCELNPIELVWADIKNYVARNNTTFKFADVKNLLEEGTKRVTAEKWRNCVNHVIKEEDKMRGIDNSIDNSVDSFIIRVTESASSSDLTSSSEESEIE